MLAAARLGLAILALCASCQVYADFPSAVRRYQAGEYEAAFVEFKQLAEMGHPASQYNVGVMYQLGQGVLKSGPRAYAWAKIAAEGGNPSAIAMEARLRPVFAEDAAAIVAEVESEFGTKALEERLMPRVLPNCDFSAFESPKLRQEGKSGLRYPSDALDRGIEGEVVVEFLVGADGRARDARIVSSLVRDVWQAWLGHAMRKLTWEPARRPDGSSVAATSSVRFNFRIDGPADYSAARKRVGKLQAAAESGDVSSQYLYGLILATHPEFKKTWSDALPWFQKAATAGLPQAQYQLGYSLLEGRGCEPDAAKAMRWLELAARNELPDAQVTLARMMLERREREGVDKPLLWLRRAVASKDETGRIELAALLAADESEAVRNPAEAIKLVDELLVADADNPLAHEIRAAALASSGDYSRAVQSQQRAVKLATARGWDLSAMQARLAAYQAARPWYGRLIGR